MSKGRTSLSSVTQSIPNSNSNLDSNFKKDKLEAGLGSKSNILRADLKEELRAGSSAEWFHREKANARWRHREIEGDVSLEFDDRDRDRDNTTEEVGLDNDTEELRFDIDNTEDIGVDQEFAQEIGVDQEFTQKIGFGKDDLTEDISVNDTFARGISANDDVLARDVAVNHDTVLENNSDSDSNDLASHMMAHEQPRPDEDNTQHSGSSLSNLSNLESDTDEFGKRLIEHARDQKRLRDATNGTIQAFRHGRARPRLGLTLENVSRNGVQGDKKPEQLELAASRSQGSHSGSEHSESSNVPRAWGRRARHRNDFLRRIHTHGGDVAHENDPDAIWPRRTLYTGDSDRRRSGDWAAATADVPIRSIEPESPLSRPHSSQATFPRQKRSDLLARIIELEQEEARQGGPRNSPGHKRRSSELNRLREIANVKEMGVTRNRLDELDPVSRSKNHDETAEIIQEEDKEGDEPALNTSPEDETSPDVDVEPVRRTPSDEYRPGHRRQDSRDLLKRLARAASVTPSPTNRQLTSPSRRRLVSSPSGQRDPSPLQGANSLPTPEQTPQPPKTAPAQTPQVTGAWLDTPAPNKTEDATEEEVIEGAASTAVRQSEPAADDIKLPKRPSNHPKSALEVVLAEANKADRQDQTFGDETLQSLKGLVAQEGDDEETTRFDEDTLDLIRKVSKPVHQAAKDKEEENALLEAMARTLKSTRSSLKDAARSMKRVETQVESAEVSAGVSKGHSSTECEHCGHGRITLSLLVSQAWAHFLSRFYNWPKGGRLRFTWLGLSTVLFVAWCFSEVTLCEVYCHKTTAFSMVGSGVDLSAPAMPFVTLTIFIKRPFAFILEPAGYICAWLIWITGIALQTLFPSPDSPGFSAGRAVKALGTKTALGVVRSFNAGYIYRDDRIDIS